MDNDLSLQKTKGEYRNELYCTARLEPVPVVSLRNKALLKRGKERHVKRLTKDTDSHFSANDL